MNRNQIKILKITLYNWIVICLSLGIILLLVGYFSNFTYENANDGISTYNLHNWLNTFKEGGYPLTIFTKTFLGVISVI